MLYNNHVIKYYDYMAYALCKRGYKVLSDMWDRMWIEERKR